MPVSFLAVGKADPQTIFALQVSFDATKPAVVISEIPENQGPHVSAYLDTICEKVEAFFNLPKEEITFYVQDLKSGELFECVPQSDVWVRIKADRNEVEKVMGETLLVSALHQELEYEPGL